MGEDGKTNYAVGAGVLALSIFAISMSFAGGGEIHQAFGNVIGGIIGAAGAFYAVKVTLREQAANEAASDQRLELRRVARIIAGLKSEINETLFTADAQHESAAALILKLKEAAKRGQQITTALPAENMFRLTDGVMYRALASELGALPEGLITDIVKFYNYARTIETVAVSGATVQGGAEVMIQSVPRLRYLGGVLQIALTRFAEANFDPLAATKVTNEERLKVADDVGYPIRELAARRGVTL